MNEKSKEFVKGPRKQVRVFNIVERKMKSEREEENRRAWDDDEWELVRTALAFLESAKMIYRRRRVAIIENIC